MEGLFLRYYWLAPVVWIVVIISNRILGIVIAKLNQKTVGIVPPGNVGQWVIVYIIRLFLFVPLVIYLWRLSSKVLALNEIYLLIAGYQLLLWTTAVIRQLASLLSHHCFSDLLYCYDFDPKLVRSWGNFILSGEYHLAYQQGS